MMNRRVKIGLAICFVLAVAVVLRLALGGGKPVRPRPAPPKTLLMRCADTGRITEIPFEQAQKIADGMTYVELSTDPTFMEQFTSACFFPHTNIEEFPSVHKVLKNDGAP